VTPSAPAGTARRYAKLSAMDTCPGVRFTADTWNVVRSQSSRRHHHASVKFPPWIQHRASRDEWKIQRVAIGCIRAGHAV
jgi:hypothetical protein